MVMTTKYRGRIDIIATILKGATARGLTKTRLMYLGMLSYGQTQDYLDFLMHHALLSKNPGDMTYRTTEKGAQFLVKYDELASVLSQNKPEGAPSLSSAKDAL